jgi:hypothetical protein
MQNIVLPPDVEAAIRNDMSHHPDPRVMLRMHILWLWTNRFECQSFSRETNRIAFWHFAFYRLSNMDALLERWLGRYSTFPQNGNSQRDERVVMLQLVSSTRLTIRDTSIVRRFANCSIGLSSITRENRRASCQGCNATTSTLSTICPL